MLSATNDENPRVSLDQIYSALCQSRSESHLVRTVFFRLELTYRVLQDPLNMLPHLLPSSQPAAKNLIALIGECSSAKEVLIAVQEILERVDTTLSLEMEEEEEEHDDASRASPTDQLISLISLYNSGMPCFTAKAYLPTVFTAIPRLKLRKKSPSETIQPLLPQIESTIQLAGSRLTRSQGCEIISGVSNLSLSVLSWATSLSQEDSAACQVCVLGITNIFRFTVFPGDLEALS